MTEGRDSRLLLVAVAIVGAACVANVLFNHTAWGPGLRARGVYVFAFYLPFGVILPAAYLGWVVGSGHGKARWLGTRVGWRDVVATAVALVVGGVLLAGAVKSGPVPYRLFALLLVASTAEVLIFLGVLGNAIQVAVPAAWRWRSGLLALVVSSVVFGLFHFTYPAPWNTLERALTLMVVWVPVSLLFLVSRSLLGAVVLNNLLAVSGFLKNGIVLPGAAATGWWRAVLACVIFVVVLRVAARRQRG